VVRYGGCAGSEFFCEEEDLFFGGGGRETHFGVEGAGGGVGFDDFEGEAGAVVGAGFGFDGLEEGVGDSSFAPGRHDKEILYVDDRFRAESGEDAAAYGNANRSGVCDREKHEGVWVTLQAWHDFAAYVGRQTSI